MPNITPLKLSKRSADASEGGALERVLMFLLLLTLLGFCGVLLHYSKLTDLFLEYPFWWPDTFDWTKQAIVILKKSGDFFDDAIFVWRPREPFFLSVLALVLLTNFQSAILILLGVAEICFSIGLYKLGRAIGLTRRDALFIVVLLVLNYSFQLFSYYIMTDFIGITAMLWVSILLVKALRQSPEQFTVGQAALAYSLIGLSSITQIFTLIPGIVFSGVYFLVHARKMPIVRRAAPLLVGLIAVAAIRGLVSLVKVAYFGTTLDDRLKYLKITTESFGFYGEVLLVFCAPLIFVALWRLITTPRAFRVWPFSPVQLFLGGTSAAFLMLVLFYSTWQEARLVTFFLPVIYLLGFSFWGGHNGSSSGQSVGLIEIVIATYLSMLPVNHIMAPRVSFYSSHILKPLSLLNTNSFTFALAYQGEDRRMPQCVEPDPASGQNGSGYFTKEKQGCDPYLHYNLKVYWCYKNRVNHCFKENPQP